MHYRKMMTLLFKQICKEIVDYSTAMSRIVYKNNHC